jgi:hypothetical protein
MAGPINLKLLTDFFNKIDHEETHALQQSPGSFELLGQTCSSSRSALASFRSSVSKPSVNQP